MTHNQLGPALIVAGLAAGCSDTAAPLDPAATECRHFEVSHRKARMRVPIGSAIEHDAARGSVLIRPNPNGRLMRYLSLAPLAGLTLSPPDQSTVLANGHSISYTVDATIGGGSGGPEAELIGDMLLDERTPLIVICSDQSENGPDPKWCLDYLGTLEPEASPGDCE